MDDKDIKKLYDKLDSIDQRLKEQVNIEKEKSDDKSMVGFLNNCITVLNCVAFLSLIILETIYLITSPNPLTPSDLIAIVAILIAVINGFKR